MAWKFLSIPKANARIDELEKQNAELIKERDTALASVSDNSIEIQAECERLTKQAADASARVTQLEADLGTARASIESGQKKIADLEAKLSAKEEEVKVRISRQALETQSQLGQPAQPTAPKAGTVQPGAETGMQRVLSSAKADLDRAGYVRKN